MEAHDGSPMEIHKSSLDSSAYRHIALDNKLSVLLVSNPVFKKTSCALSVAVGSFDEPDEHPGLAHFLEHMLFMGTGAFPGENDFSNFLSMHNGYSNAYTADEITVYYFDIDTKEAQKALDMFAHFFIDPLFSKGSVKREISSVDSEYLNTLNSAECRLEALFGRFVKDGDKSRRFSCGNKKTLRKRGIEEVVARFWEETYSSDLMSLVVTSNESLDFLEQCASEFSKIMLRNYSPRNKLLLEKGKKSSSFPAESADFSNISPEHHSHVVQMRPLGDEREMVVFVVLPPTMHLYKYNLHAFIEFAITTNEAGCIVSMLKARGLIYSLDFDYTLYSENTRIKISLGLTQKGFDEYRTVLDLLAAYLEAIDVSKYEYMRLKRLRGEEFRYKELENQLDLCETLASDMQYYNVENVLNHEYIFEEYNRELVEQMITSIGNTDHWLIVLLHPGGEVEHKEEYYSIEYKVIGRYERRQIDLRPAGATARAKEDKYLSAGKGPIPVKSKQATTVKYETGRITYAHDPKYLHPKSEINVLLRHRELSRMSVAAQIHLKMVENIFLERYAREMENYHLSLETSIGELGVLVKFEGISEFILEMCEAFMELLMKGCGPSFSVSAGPSDSARSPYDGFDGEFENIRTEIEMEYDHQLLLSPYRRLNEVLVNEITGGLSSEEKLKIVKNFQKSDLRFLDDYYLEIVAVGDVELKDVQSLYSKLQKTHVYVYDLHRELALDTVHFSTKDNFNNCIGLYYPVADYKSTVNATPSADSCIVDENVRECSIMRKCAIGELLHQICNEKFYNDLRTKEELGYVAYSSIRMLNKTEFLSFVVQSEKPVDFLRNRILDFMGEILEMIKAMKADVFETYKQSLIDQLKEPLLNLRDFSLFIWRQHLRENMDINYSEKAAKMVESLTPEDLLSAFSGASCIQVSSRFTENKLV